MCYVAVRHLFKDCPQKTQKAEKAKAKALAAEALKAALATNAAGSEQPATTSAAEDEMRAALIALLSDDGAMAKLGLGGK